MSETLYRVNDIVTVTNYLTSPNRITRYIGKVKKIKLTDHNTEHDEYVVITGQGVGRNTVANIIVKVLYKLDSNQHWYDTSIPEEVTDDITYEENPHNVYKITVNDYTEQITAFNNKINFLTRLFNRSISYTGTVKKPRPFKRK
jgi:hypothetical protein